MKRQRTSFKRLLNVVIHKEPSNEGVQFLERMTNSFAREAADFHKSVHKDINTLSNLQKDIAEVAEKQNIHYRTFTN